MQNAKCKKKHPPITPPNTITIAHLAWMLWNMPWYSCSTITSSTVIVRRKAIVMNNDNRYFPEDASSQICIYCLSVFEGQGQKHINSINQSINQSIIWGCNGQKFIKCFLIAFLSSFVLEEEMLQQVMIYIMSQHSFRINILLCITGLQLHSWVGYSQ